VPAKRPPHARGSKGQEKRTWSRPSGMGGKMVQTGQTQAMRNRLKGRHGNTYSRPSAPGYGGQSYPNNPHTQYDYQMQAVAEKGYRAQLKSAINRDTAANPWYRNRYGRMYPQSLRWHLGGIEKMRHPPINARKKGNKSLA
jgi:hypothetical protein